MRREPSAETHEEVHEHGEDPDVGIVPDEQGPGSRGYGGGVLQGHLLRALLEKACEDTSTCSHFSPAPLSNDVK